MRLIRDNLLGAMEVAALTLLRERKKRGILVRGGA